MAPIISIQNLSKTFRGADGVNVHALEGINLDVQQGEFISLIGPSGCGKSTLLRIIADLVQSSSGAITVNGKSPQQARKDRDYGFVFQSPTLYEWRTVLKNVQLPLEIMKYPKAQRDERAREMLKLVELSDFEGKFPWQLSGGMQQRVSIARALAFEPRILLMDEPFGALDEMTRERMNNELLSIWRKLTGMTVIFVTHSISEAVYLSSRVVVMSPRPGRIAEVIDIHLPRPRGPQTRDLDDFFHLTNKVRHALREGVGVTAMGIGE
ncbi:MAG: ABC transporter ATP-binding protein [Chloroflexi bacterium]|jgi:NitT/TauT family transport system ATP-binding protein|uniref:ABC transporter ATP-binding protein n=1 Tax=Candidatus Flexifilum breve TaxID=3140694 RepID=UPI0031356318|nr:ABC transporter ATP-binding protein [Chloroflexota bacterium]